MYTDPAANSGEGVVLFNDLYGLSEFSFADQGYIAPRILVGGACILTRGIKKCTAYARAAMFMLDMFFIFMSEEAER
jgi:hypothetical protein